MHPTRLTFFCELEPGPLTALFQDAAVLGHLRALGASVSLGVLDLTPERADVVRRLGEAGVPVIAWQLLPKDQGYWFNQGNAAHAQARYTDFRAWTATHALRWDGVGLDIEPDIHELTRALQARWRMVPALLPRLWRGARLREAREAYAALVARIRADGHRVDSYQLPFLLDERRARATLLQRLTGVVDVGVDREVWMLYTSLVRPHGPELLASYGPHARGGGVGVGITGGGVDVPGLIEVPPLTWEEFARDLRLARCFTPDVHVFSLEGCVRQDFLARLRDFDWTAPAPPPPGGRVDTVRRVAGGLLRASAGWRG
ncbi:hypothetical protein [Melittangium boletus]|uniref:hypothetical protein n=1 Tax=Melittangium boletus TaxID=83453 RepID=UPI003DA60F99